MNFRYTLSVLIAATLFIAGCATPIKKGDVDLYEHHGHGSIFTGPARPGYVLRFPEVSIGSTNMTVIRVRNLPEPIFPTWADLDVPEEEANRYSQNYNDNQPWRSAILQIQFKDTDGNAFFTKTLDFSKDWNGNSSPGRSNSHRCISVILSPWDDPPYPQYLNYDLAIKVIRPSMRSKDKLTFSAFRNHSFNSKQVEPSASVRPGGGRD